MEIWQKVLLAVLAILLVIAVSFNIIKIRQVKALKEDIVELQNQLSELKKEEPKVTVLRVHPDYNIKSGTIFDPSVIEVALLPESLSSPAYVTDINMLKDGIWRINVRGGGLITTDMLALEPVYPTDRYHLIMVDAVTPSTQVGDFVDLRMITPDGIDLVVLPKKRITNIYSSGLEFVLSEAELMIYEGAILDRAMHRGTILYGSKYVDPSLQNKLYSMYIPPDEVVDYMNLNRNMLFPYIESSDIEGMRAYIESTQPWNKYGASLFNTALEEIRDTEQKTTGAIGSQAGAMRKARQEFIEFMKAEAQKEGYEYRNTDTGVSQSGNTEPNPAQGNISGQTSTNTINSDGTYTDSNGTLRYPDGTPVIQANDIVNTAGQQRREDEAPLDNNTNTTNNENNNTNDNNNINVPNINNNEELLQP